MLYLRLKCIELDFGFGSAPDPAGRAHSAPQPRLSCWIQEIPLLRKGEGVKRRGKGKKGKEKNEKGSGGEEGEKRGGIPPALFR